MNRIERGDYIRGNSTYHQRRHFSKGINRVIDNDNCLTEDEKGYLHKKRDRILNWLKERENSSEYAASSWCGESLIVC